MTSSSSIWVIASSARTRRSVKPAGLLLACALLAVPCDAAPASEVEQVLDRAGKHVEEFWNYFTAVTCTESAVQTKLDDKGRVIAERRSTADYLVLLQLDGNDLSVEESRLEKGRKEKHSGASLLTSNGFPLLVLVFHPHFQSSYEFRELAPAPLGSQLMRRLAFTHVKGSPSPSVLLLKGREYPLEWKGIAWLIPESGQIVRIEADLPAPLEDLGLLNLSAAVDYTPVSFAGGLKYWLPQTATVEAATRRQHWRNVHSYAAYRRFNVETETRTGGAN